MKATFFSVKHPTLVFGVALAFFVLNSGTVFGQLTPSLISYRQKPSYIELVFSGNCHTISVYPNGALSYYEYHTYTNPSHHYGKFVYNNNASVVKTFNLPEGVYVTDFRQYMGTDFIAFCGYRVQVHDPNGLCWSDEIGVIGWFNINNTMNYSTIDVYYVDVPEVCRFTKVEPYYNEPNVSIVAIAMMYGEPYRNAIFYLDRVQFDVNATYNCNLYPVRYKDYLGDIVVSKQFVTFVGVENVAERLFIRREYLNQMSTPNELNNIYAFPFADDMGFQDVHAVYMGNKLIRTDDKIAINAVNAFDPNDTRSRYRFIDVSTLTMTGAQEFKMYDKIGVNGIAYIHNPKLLCAQTTADPVTAGQYSAVVLINPSATTSYYADYIFHSDYGYESIDCLNYDGFNCEHFLLGGPFSWFLKKASHPTSFNGCNETERINVDILQPVQYEIEQDPLNNSMQKTCTKEPADVYSQSPNQECYD